jgi:hypothetical protein
LTGVTNERENKNRTNHGTLEGGIQVTVTKNVCNVTVVRHDDHVVDPPTLSVFSINGVSWAENVFVVAVQYLTRGNFSKIL